MISKIKKQTKKNETVSINLTKNWDENFLVQKHFDIKDIELKFGLIANEIEKELRQHLSFKELEISINLVNSEAIKALNKMYRDKDKSTDVLSFPSGNLDDTFISKTQILDLGDIFINVDILESQAKLIESNKETELAFLFMHACLHLIGYDHIEEDQAEVMYQRQRKILNDTNIRKENI